MPWKQSFCVSLLLLSSIFSVSAQDASDREGMKEMEKVTPPSAENVTCKAEATLVEGNTTTWKFPVYDGFKLAFCTGEICGRIPANWFCEMKGFRKAASFERLEDLTEDGVGECEETRSIGTDITCGEGKSCHSFKEVMCEDPVTTCPEESMKEVGAGTSFEHPELDGRKMDFCASPEEGCGKEAADLFCIFRSFLGAARWVRFDDVNVGRNGTCRSTIQIGSLAVCDRNCSSFSMITCENLK